MKRYVKSSSFKNRYEIIETAVLNIEGMIDSGAIEDEDEIRHEAESQIYFLAEDYSLKDQEELTNAVLDELRAEYLI